MAQPFVYTIGPLATADADGICLSQTALLTAGQYLAINGALAGSANFDADSICASQTPGGAGALTINGVLAVTQEVAGAGMPPTGTATSARVAFGTPTRVYITCAGNNSGRTFTVTGTLQSPGTFGPGVVVAQTVTGANTNVVATDQLFSTVTSVTISGSSTGAVTVGHFTTCTLDQQRQGLITSSGDDSDITFTMVSLDQAGNPQTETITGPNATTGAFSLSAKTIVSIRTSAPAGGTVTVGTTEVARSPIFYPDRYQNPFNVGIGCTVTGTVDYDVQHTFTAFDEGSETVPTWFVNSGIDGKTANQDGNYAYAVRGVSLLLNSGTGSVTITAIQSAGG